MHSSQEGRYRGTMRRKENILVLSASQETKATGGQFFAPVCMSLPDCQSKQPVCHSRTMPLPTLSGRAKTNASERSAPIQR